MSQIDNNIIFYYFIYIKKSIKNVQEYKVPARIYALCKYAHRMLTKTLLIEIYPGIFDNEQAEIYLLIDDIVQFCSMEKIRVTTITCYMR